MKKEEVTKAETNDVYENISNSLDTSFDGEEVTELVDVKEQAEKCKDIVDIKDDPIKLVDEDYIREETKNLIDVIVVAMSKIGQDIRIGSPPRLAEVLSQLANSKQNAISTLLNMNKIKLDAKLKLSKKDSPKNMTVNNNMNVSSSDMLKMINGAKKKNSLNNIEAKFDIKTEKNLE